jgi:hypothetical protein
LGDRYYEARSLTDLGEAACAAGDMRSAHDSWQRAHQILTELDHPDAGQVGLRLLETGSDVEVLSRSEDNQ